MKKLLATVGIASVMFGAVVDAQVNPYTERDGKYEMTFSDESRVELSSSEPKLTLHKEGISLGILYGLSATGGREGFSNRVEWKTPEMEVHAYPLSETEIEFEVILNERPATNEFVFTLSGQEGLTIEQTADFGLNFRKDGRLLYQMYTPEIFDKNENKDLHSNNCRNYGRSN